MLTIDGIIFTLQRAGGISVIFKSLLAYLSDTNFEVNNIVDGINLQDSIPNTSSLKTQIREARTFERYRACRVRKSDSVLSSLEINNHIYHSSYYRTPTDPGIANVLTVYDFMYERYRQGPAKWIHTIQKNNAIKRAQSIICISKSTQDDLFEYAKLTSTQKIYVIHCGVSDIFRPCEAPGSQALKETPPYILFVGQRAGYKNFKLALATLSVLPDFELRCVGGGDLVKSDLEGWPSDVLKRVKHMGFTTDSELNLLYNNAACLLYPSSYEGFGIPVIEAMKAGCPVVSTNCKAIVEIGGDSLQVVPEHDPRALANAVLKSISSERAKLVEMGIKNAKKYSWDSTNEKTVRVYKDLGL